MLFAKRYEIFDEMNKIYNMHFEAKETKMYLRTRMIMLSWDGYTVPEIGRILDIHPHTVRHWIKQYNEKGIDGLYDAEKPVPQPQYSEELENEIADLAFTPPKQLGLPFGRWTCERMAQYLVDTGKVKHISGEGVSTCLVLMTTGQVKCSTSLLKRRTAMSLKGSSQGSCSASKAGKYI